LRGIEAEYSLQHQRRADRHVNGRVRAGEHQAETAVWDFLLVNGFREILDVEFEFVGRGFILTPSCGIDQLAPRNGKQPGLGVFRTAFNGPVDERRSESIGESVFGRGDVSGTGCEERDQLAVAVARRGFGFFLDQRATTRVLRFSCYLAAVSVSCLV